MFLIKTRIGRSAIHGNGVFAVEPVAAGETIWRFDPAFDRVLSEEEVAALPEAARTFLDMYGYRALDLPGQWVLSGDDARFLNHSADPNTGERPFESFALRDIAAGEEITCDYGAMCVEGADFGSGEPAPLPHEGVLTRLGVSADGIGVFALRDIPAGTALFARDAGETVRVPAAEVERIAEPELRRLYLDFCPLVDGAYVAPRHFDQLTISWYLNHSDTPNVAADERLEFTTLRPIRQGEELRVDYRGFSDHAGRYAEAWRKAPRGSLPTAEATRYRLNPASD